MIEIWILSGIVLTIAFIIPFMDKIHLSKNLMTEYQRSE